MRLDHTMTFGTMLRDITGKYPDRPAICDTEKSYSYQHLWCRTGTVAARMLAQGIGHGTRVGLYGGNSADLIVCYCAVLSIGATAVMLGARLSADEFAARMQVSKAEFLLYGETPPAICCTDERKTDSFLGAISAVPDKVFSEFPKGLAGQDDLFRAQAAVCADDVDTILFTSGTTGATKGVMSCHFARCNNARAQAEALHATCEDVFCTMLPIFHCFSLSANVAAALSVGACISLPKSHHTEDVLRAIEKDRCTILQSVPTFFSVLMARTDLDQFDLSSLRTGMMAGSIYPPKLFCDVSERLKIKLHASLGQTESTAGFTFDDGTEPMEIASRSVGKFMEHIEGKLVDVTSGRAVKTGEAGEILIRGYNVMLGYCSENGTMLWPYDASGWLHTGDVAKQDEDGRLYVVGRKKELIIRGGENISPHEIEEVIEADSRVLKAVVIGVPDSHYMEECCACLICKECSGLSKDDIRRLVGKRLSSYKIPRYVLFFDAFPLNSSGKISLVKLKEQALRRLYI